MARRDSESATDSGARGVLSDADDDADDADGVYDAYGREGLLDHNLFFGDYSGSDDAAITVERVTSAQRRSDGAHSRSSRAARRGKRRLLVLIGAFFLAVLAAANWLVVVPVYHYLHPSDYAGAGSGIVVVTVHAGDGASEIGNTLHSDGVVASQRAFTTAASNDAKSQDIQPGAYRLHRHMSAKSALSLLLSPSARLRGDVTVAEGATVVDVERQLVAPSCGGASTPATKCGPGLQAADVRRALANVKALDLPTDYTTPGAKLSSVEGFLFPATYYFPAGTSAPDALQQMVGNFIDQVHGTDIAAQAKRLGLTPYQELIIASIAQAEAKFPADFPKIARVILNRLTAHSPLQVDATSAYAAKLEGLDPSKVVYDQVASLYNTYHHSGLPPTPIGNPDLVALQAAAHPAAGNWLFYVNGDAAGHLAFTNSAATFAKLAATCRQNHWGCG